MKTIILTYIPIPSLAQESVSQKYVAQECLPKISVPSIFPVPEHHGREYRTEVMHLSTNYAMPM